MQLLCLRDNKVKGVAGMSVLAGDGVGSLGSAKGELVPGAVREGFPRVMFKDE